MVDLNSPYTKLGVLGHASSNLILVNVLNFVYVKDFQ